MMAVRMSKLWHTLSQEAAAALPAQLGVYEIADADGQTVAIRYAGGLTLFGLRQRVTEEAEARGPGFQFRVEVNQQYQSRWRELLMAYQADHNGLPAENKQDNMPLGVISPA
jgi:hypothetical protein